MSDSPKHRSTQADHPDVAPVLPRFVGRLPGQVAKLRELVAAGGGGREELQRLVHTLRGNGRMFGFAGMTELAAEVDEMLLAGRPLEEVAGAVGRLAGYMESVEGYGVG